VPDPVVPGFNNRFYDQAVVIPSGSNYWRRPMLFSSPRNYDANLIYDVGLNIGQDAEFYLKKGFRVVGIEANPVVAETAAERLASFGTQLVILNHGIGPREGTLPFYVNRRHHEQSTFLHQFTNGPTWDLGYDEIAVPVTTIEPVLRKHGLPYYMKIDIEAWDMVVLRQLQALDARPKYISVETGPNTDWITALHSLGYRQFKLVNQSKNREIKLRPPAKEGAFVEHAFEWGSSGPFGEEIEAPWVPAETITAQWQGHIDAQFPGGNWFDIHAKYEA
jgi:FkbM family methyltransferase